MPHAIGFVDNSIELAHNAMIRKIKDEVTALGSGWTVNRYVDTGDNHELLLQGVGLTGLEQIYVGFRGYQNESADYYNIVCQVALGYLPSEPFNNQPSAIRTVVCAHNQRIDYWLSWNDQHIKAVLKVGTPVYEPFYVGKFLAYARPSQYPYPVVNVGTLGIAGAQTTYPATRFSSTLAAHSMGFKGNTDRIKMRNTMGVWAQPHTYPWSNTTIGGVTNSVRPVGTQYSIFPAEIHDNVSPNDNIYGVFDGVYFIGGFDNTVENTLEIGGVTYVVFQDVFRTGFNDYIAMRMDT